VTPTRQRGLPWGPRHPDGGPSNRAIVRTVGILVLLLVVLWVAWLSRGVLIWVGVSALFAVAINPAVKSVQRRLHLPRWSAIVTVYVVLLLALAAAASLLVPPLIDAGQELADDVPGYVERLQESRLVQDLDERYGLLDQLESRVTEVLGDVAGPDTAFALATRVANGLVAFVAIAVMTFLFSLYGRQLRAWVLKEAPSDQRARVAKIADDIYRVIAGYFVGLLIVAVMAGIIAWIFLSIIGVPGAAVLGFWVSISTLLPLVGATIGAIPYVLVAFFQDWKLGVAALVFVLIYQQVENNVIQPAIQRRTVQLNPLLIIISVLIGAELLGLVGVLLAIPIAGTLQVVLQDLWRTRRSRRTAVPALEGDPGPI
jgi:predicted PurR-regulated permease PerM